MKNLIAFALVLPVALFLLGCGSNETTTTSTATTTTGLNTTTTSYPVTTTTAPVPGWATKAPMPTARTFLSAVSTGGKIYAIGGSNGSIEFNNIEEYNPAGNTWLAKNHITPARFALGACVVSSEVIIMGGASGDNFSNLTYYGTTEAYNPATNLIGGPKASTLIPLARFGIAVLNNDIYILGGQTTGGVNVSSVEVYTGNTWFWSTPMPHHLRDCAAVTIGGKIYVMGGYTSSGQVTSEVMVFDPGLDSWSSAAPMPTARTGLAAAVLNNKIYAIGGFSGSSDLNTLEIYDPSADSWTAGPAMLTARKCLAAAVVNNCIYVLGGDNITMGPLATVESYTP